MGAVDEGQLAAPGLQCNRTYATQCLQRLVLRMVTGLGCLAELLEKAFLSLSGTAVKHRDGRTAQRPKNPVKPHPSMAYKG